MKLSTQRTKEEVSMKKDREQKQKSPLKDSFKIYVHINLMEKEPYDISRYTEMPVFKTYQLFGCII